MPKIVFTEAGGGRREIDAPLGITLMEAARQFGVPGVVARFARSPPIAAAALAMHWPAH
jgi:hypothetical protein